MEEYHVEVTLKRSITYRFYAGSYNEANNMIIHNRENFKKSMETPETIDHIYVVPAKEYDEEEF